MTRTTRTLIVLAIALVASACTPSDSADTTTTVEATTTTTSTEAPPATATTTTTTTTPSGPTTTQPLLTPPTTRDKDDVALDAFVPVDGYAIDTEILTDDTVLFSLFDPWIPERIIDGLGAAVFEGDEGQRVSVISTIPITSLRGDPNLAAFFAVSAGRGETEESVVDGITTIEAPSGGTFEIWSDGDGVLIATAEDPADAHSYMVARAALYAPNDVWDSGSCLYLAPTEPAVFGVYPYAPFMDDLVVPCSGPHNAEVLHATFEATSIPEFDPEAVHYQRNYECDREYRNTFGSSVQDHRASLVTYMPDQDEWDRGDRYLACVVVLYDESGEPELFEGAMADLPNLEVVMTPRDCTDGSITNVVDCGTVHEQQYLGSVLAQGDTYPALGDESFDELCEVFLEDLTVNSDAELRVTGLGLMPYSFEIGDREIRCYAIAIVDGFLPANVVGSFYEKWTVIDESATSA